MGEGGRHLLVIPGKESWVARRRKQLRTPLFAAYNQGLRGVELIDATRDAWDLAGVDEAWLDKTRKELCTRLVETTGFIQASLPISTLLRRVGMPAVEFLGTDGANELVLYQEVALNDELDKKAKNTHSYPDSPRGGEEVKPIVVARHRGVEYKAYDKVSAEAASVTLAFLEAAGKLPGETDGVIACDFTPHIAPGEGNTDIDGVMAIGTGSASYSINSLVAMWQTFKHEWIHVAKGRKYHSLTSEVDSYLGECQLLLQMQRYLREGTFDHLVVDEAAKRELDGCLTKAFRNSQEKAQELLKRMRNKKPNVRLRADHNIGSLEKVNNMHKNA